VGYGVLAWRLIDRFCGAIRTIIPKNVEVICARYIAARRRRPTPKELLAAKVYFAYVDISNIKSAFATCECRSQF
jgi:hypothetical protein